jgi:hypothetical protein
MPYWDEWEVEATRRGVSKELAALGRLYFDREIGEG